MKRKRAKKSLMRRIKRFFNLAVTSVIILSLLLILIEFLVRFKIGSPVLFRQVRPWLGAMLKNPSQFLNKGF